MSAPAQFRCTACGMNVYQRCVRITDLDTDGRVDFHHIRDGSGCGPVVTNFLLPQTGKTKGAGGGWSSPKTLPPSGLPWLFGSEGIDAPATLRLIERYMIARAIQLAGTAYGTVERAAKLLRMKRSTFSQTLKRYGYARTWQSTRQGGRNAEGR